MSWNIKPQVPPPDPVTGFTVTPQPFDGWAAMAWTNPSDSSVASLLLEYSEHGDDDWKLIATLSASGGLPTSRNFLAPITRSIDYRIRSRSRQGMLSDAATVDDVTLTGRFRLPFWLNRVGDPDGSKAAFGLMDPGDWGTSTGAAVVQNVAEVVSPGKESPFIDFNSTAYDQLKGARYSVPAFETDGTNSIHGWDVVQKVKRFCESGSRFILRTPKEQKIVKLQDFSWSYEDAETLFQMQFTWTVVFSRLGAVSWTEPAP